MGLVIKTNLCDQRNYSTKTRKATDIKYIVIHYTGNNGDTDEGNANYFHNNDTGDTSAHYFVDEDSITQSVPDLSIAWHCGAKTYVHPTCRNANSIGVEMCSDIVKGKYTITYATAVNAVTLVKNLMKKYNIPIENVIRHYDVTGKKCPAPWVDEPIYWQTFKKNLV